MKIKVSNLWQYIGFIVSIKDLPNVPDGNYIVLSKEEYGITVGNLQTRTEELIEEWDEDTEVALISSSVNLKELHHFKLAKIVQLVSEGWVMDKGNKYFNIIPYMQEYYVIKTLLGST